MNLELTDEQSALRDTVHRFLTEKAPMADYVRPMLADPRGTTERVWRGLAEIGATGLLVPVDHGGAGASMVEAGLVCQELGAALDPGPWLSSAVAATRALIRFGASDAGDLFGGLTDGSVVATVAPLLARACRVGRDGDALRGELDDVPDAVAADVLLVLVHNGGRTELLAVPTSAPGIRIDAKAGIDQSRKLFRVSFDGAPARLLATTGDEAVEALVDDVLVASAADAVGAAGRLLTMTVDYAKVRTQFGQAIGSFQAVAHLCVDMYETVELARCAVMHATWAADATDRAERHLAALRVKSLSGRLSTVGDQAIQVFGGIGFTWEHDAHLYLKRLLSFSRLMGSSGDYLERVGRELTEART